MIRGIGAKSPWRMLRLAAAAATIATALTLAVAAPALAGLQKEYEAFSDCPLSNPEVANCVISKTFSGEFHMGNETVPVNKTITLQGGLTNTSPDLVPAADGNTLSKTSLEVPGGLLGIELLPPLTEVNATAELAGTVEMDPAALGEEKGTVAVLPLKVKLENPALGESCYVGSNSEPLTPHLTSGTTNPPPPNTPIKGKAGTPEIRGAGKIIRVTGSSLVDNAFAVPGANGCAGILSLVVDPSIDLKTDLPSPAGRNTAVMNGELAITTRHAVINELALPELGRCVKVEGVKENGRTHYHGLYIDSGCFESTPAAEGKFEWLPGPGAGKKFTGSSLGTTLETIGLHRVTCTASTSHGEFTGAKTATVAISFTGCKNVATKAACQSAGAPAGEITTPALNEQLGFVKDEVINNGSELAVTVGWDLAGSPALIGAACGGSNETVAVTGSAIAPVASIGKMVSANTLKLVGAGGKQTPASFEEAPADTPSASFGGGASEAASLKSTQKETYEEKLEIKGAAEELE